MKLIIGGRYQVIKPLSQGAFGQTFLAQDNYRQGCPQCVVKQLIPQVVNEVTIALFESEARALEKLGHHPQIPQFFASFQENNSFYIVQEFIDGHDLSQEISKGKRLEESQVIQLLKDILEVLAFVHQNNIIHRDIKPHNIIRRQEGKLVLIDFGGVKQVGTQWLKAKQTSVSIGIGTPGYMPSEQAQNKPRLSSDVYAVGIIAIQALTGLKPTQFPEDAETGEIAWRNQADVSDDLAVIIDKMTRYDWRQRFPSAVEVLDAIKELLQLRQQQALVQQISAEDLFYRGNAHLDLRQYREAVQLYQQSLRKKPNFVNAWYNRGLALQRLGRFPEALGSFNQVIQLETNNARAWFYRGIALANLRQISDAIASWDKAIQLQPDYLEAWHYKGMILCRMQHYAEGLAAYNQALAIKSDANVWFSKGEALRELERLSEAVAAYNKALQLQSQDAEAWYQRGCCLYKLKCFSEAVVSFNQTLRLQPSHQFALQQRNLALNHLKL